MRILIIFISIILLSCTSDDGNIKGPVNNQGGFTRNSNFEAYGNFATHIDVMDAMRNEDSSGVAHAPLALSNTLNLVATGNGSIVLLGDNSVRWSHELDSGIVVAANMAADGEDNVYAVATDAHIYSFDSEGELRWKKFLDSTNMKYQVYTDLLATEDGIYSGTNKGYLAKFSFAGEKIWERKFSNALTDVFSADSSGNLIIPLTKNNFGGTDSLVYLSPEGEKIWSVGFPNFRILKNPVVGNGRISVIGFTESRSKRKSKVINLDMKGKIMWEKEIDISGRFLSLASDGTIYAVGYNSGTGEAVSGVFSLSPEGEENWQLYFSSATPSPALISENAVAVPALTREGAAVFFISRESGELLKTASLTNAPILHLMPDVNPESHIVFGGIDRLSIIKLEGNPLGNIISN